MAFDHIIPHLKDFAMPTLATFDNAYRLAAILVDRTAMPHVILATTDPLQPHRVEPAAGQRGAIALIATSDPSHSSVGFPRVS